MKTNKKPPLLQKVFSSAIIQFATFLIGSIVTLTVVLGCQKGKTVLHGIMESWPILTAYSFMIVVAMFVLSKLDD